MFRRMPAIRSQMRHILRPADQGWMDLPTVSLLPSDREKQSLAGGSLPLALANEWSLVLLARGIAHHVRRCAADGTEEKNREPCEAGWAVSVRRADMDRALHEISAFERENRPRRHAFRRREFIANTRTTLLVLSLLLLFHGFTGLVLPWTGLYPHTWVTLGSADSGAILDGQWWRSATALTLHGDIAHLAGNVAIGGVFIIFACRETGSGLGWLLIILCGMLGNLVNAWAHGPGHDSIGFSTAVFGAAGILGGLRTMLGPAAGSGARWLPMGAAFGLLALLGLGGDKTDVGAHIFGFFWGLVLGSGAGVLLIRRGVPGRAAQAALGGLAGLLVAGSWLAAHGTG